MKTARFIRPLTCCRHWLPSLAVGLLASCLAVAQPMITEAVTVHYRPASDLVPILKPLVPNPGSVAGMADQLIIRTTEDNLLSLRGIIAQLDMQPRRLVISLRRDSLENLHRQGSEIHGQLQSGDVTLSTGRRYARDGIGLRLYDTEHDERHYGSQQVQATEGHEAFIQTGVSVPVGQRALTWGPAGPQVVDSIQYRDVTSGFYVSPSIQGDRVTLRIRQHSARTSRSGGGAFDLQSADTVVTGRLGEWMRIGGAADQGSYSGNGTLYSTNHDRHASQVILLKVEERR